MHSSQDSFGSANWRSAANVRRRSAPTSRPLRVPRPDGGESNYEGLRTFFAALRSVYDDLTIGGTVVMEGNRPRPIGISARRLTNRWQFAPSTERTSPFIAINRNWQLPEAIRSDRPGRCQRLWR
jgi:hypothetical protein